MQEDAAAAALGDFAQTLGAYPGSGVPPNQYEAENATLHSLSLEDTHAGFTGWGYVAGWNADGQSIDFHLSMRAGRHTLTFRYAAGAGDARRLISINGHDVFPNQRFPATGSWDRYRTCRVSAHFLPGPCTVSVVYDSAKGSTNFLNLDNLAVK